MDTTTFFMGTWKPKTIRENRTPGLNPVLAQSLFIPHRYIFVFLDELVPEFLCLDKLVSKDRSAQHVFNGELEPIKVYAQTFL